MPWFPCLGQNGEILPGAKAYYWVSGTAQSVAATTYSAPDGTANANPVVADAYGRLGPVYLDPGTNYDLVLKTSADVSVRTQTYIGGVPIGESGAGAVDITVTAGENISAGAAIYISDGSAGKTGGRVYNGDSTNPYSSTLNTVGFATAALTTGNSGTMRLSGVIENQTGLTAGTLYYVGSAGAITSSAPATNNRLIGQALSTTTLDVWGTTRLASAPSQAANDGLYASASGSLGRVAFAAPGIMNFTTAWAALAPGTKGNALTSDGTNWVSKGTCVTLPATLTNVVNNTETAAVIFTVPANTWADGDFIQISIAALEKNAKGSDGTILAKVNAGAGSQITIANGTTWTNNATEFKIVRGFWLVRVGGDVWIQAVSTNVSATNSLMGAQSFESNQAGTNIAVSGISTPTNFTSDFVVSLKITLSATDAAFYYKPQSARVVQFKAS